MEESDDIVSEETVKRRLTDPYDLWNAACSVVNSSYKICGRACHNKRKDRCCLHEGTYSTACLQFKKDGHLKEKHLANNVNHHVFEFKVENGKLLRKKKDKIQKVDEPVIDQQPFSLSSVNPKLSYAVISTDKPDVWGITGESLSMQASVLKVYPDADLITTDTMLLVRTTPQLSLEQILSNLS
jgi:hypothetical protein